MTELSEERLGELITALRPAPTGWVEAAIELPRARAATDELVARAVADGEARAAILADPDAALLAAGVEPRPQLVERLRTQLGSGER